MTRTSERAAEATTVTAAERAGDDQPGVPMYAPGTWLGRYRLDRVLGHGGMGVVFAAHDVELERAVALKLLRDGDEQARARLVREARTMARVRHPNLITVHEVDSAGDRDFVVMELIDGVSLDRWLAGGRSLAQILDVFRQAARGLIAAHAQGVVHRDFKPRNVLIGDDGRVVVTDFGLARAIAPGAATPGPSDPRTAPTISTGDPASWSPALTATGAAIGTPAYMAPEQWDGGAPDPRADQFAFCVSLWEALAGTRPFTGGSSEELRTAIAAGALPRGERIPSWLRTVLRRGLAPRPEARWPSMAALIDAIERARRRRRVATAALVGAALAIPTALYLGTRDTSSPAVARGPNDSLCQPLEVAAAELWTPARRARLDRHLAGTPEVAGRLDAYFGELTARWRAAYQGACADRDDRQHLARVACLESRRDRMLSYLDALEQIPPAVLPVVPFDEVIGGFEPCSAAVPMIAPVAASAEVRRRQRVLETEAIALTFGPRWSDDEAWSSLLRRADALDHPPLAAELRVVHATTLHRRGDHAAARVAYDDAALRAEQAGALEVRAMAMTGLAELALRTAAGPAAIDDALRRARAATAAVGEPALLVAFLDALAAERMATAGDVDGAIAMWEAVHRTMIRQGNHRRAAGMIEMIAETLIARARPDDLVRARTALAGEIERQRALLGPHAVHVAALERQLAALP